MLNLYQVLEFDELLELPEVVAEKVPVTIDNGPVASGPVMVPLTVIRPLGPTVN